MSGLGASIGNQRFGACSRPTRSLAGNATGVANEMDLARQPSTGAPEGLIGGVGVPLFPGTLAAARLPRTEVESIIPSRNFCLT